MKKLFLLIPVFALFASCVKTPSNTTTNNTTASPIAAYSVDGIMDITLDASVYSTVAAYMPVTLSYHDSLQQSVSVTVSGTPNGIYCGSVPTPGSPSSTGPWIGYPTFTIDLEFVHNVNTSYTPSTYPMTITCTSALSGTKTFNFNLTLK